jgi:hypothetical protein
MAQLQDGPNGLALLLGESKALLEGFLIGWLTESLGAPSPELNVSGIVQPTGEEDRRAWRGQQWNLVCGQ